MRLGPSFAVLLAVHRGQTPREMAWRRNRTATDCVWLKARRTVAMDRPFGDSAGSSNDVRTEGFAAGSRTVQECGGVGRVSS